MYILYDTKTKEYLERSGQWSCSMTKDKRKAFVYRSLNMIKRIMNRYASFTGAIGKPVGQWQIQEVISIKTKPIEI